MRTIIAGSRTLSDIQQLYLALNNCSWSSQISTVISGGARGADFLGQLFAKQFNLPLEIYAADWTKHGRSAGYLRNVQMAEKAQALIALWDQKSSGTRHMVEVALNLGLVVYVEYF